MASGSNSLANVPNISSLPNLRLLCKRSTTELESVNYAIYRSSRPDNLIEADLDSFRQLGIKCIVDFRSIDEYKTSDGHRLLDEEYALYKVVLPNDNYKPGQSVKCELVSLKKQDSEYFGSRKLRYSKKPRGNKNRKLGSSKESLDQIRDFKEKRHYFINFFSWGYVKRVFNRLPWQQWCLGILHIVWDVVLFNKFKTFRKFMSVEAIGAHGIFGQYVDIVEVSQPAVCSALKLLSDPANLPALINCAHGKDRTGIISALILMCLRVPKDHVAEEYSLSTTGLESIKDSVYEDIVEKNFLKEEFCSSKADTMKKLLNYIEDRYQSVEQYMTFIGFTEQEQEQLRNNLKSVPHSPN